MSAVFSEFSFWKWIFGTALHSSSTLNQADARLAQTLYTSANTMRNLKQTYFLTTSSTSHFRDGKSVSSLLLETPRKSRKKKKQQQQLLPRTISGKEFMFTLSVYRSQGSTLAQARLFENTVMHINASRLRPTN